MGSQFRKKKFVFISLLLPLILLWQNCGKTSLNESGSSSEDSVDSLNPGSPDSEKIKIACGETVREYTRPLMVKDDSLDQILGSTNFELKNTQKLLSSYGSFKTSNLGVFPVGELNYVLDVPLFNLVEWSSSVNKELVPVPDTAGGAAFCLTSAILGKQYKIFAKYRGKLMSKELFLPRLSFSKNPYFYGVNISKQESFKTLKGQHISLPICRYPEDPSVEWSPVHCNDLRVYDSAQTNLLGQFQNHRNLEEAISKLATGKYFVSVRMAYQVLQEDGTVKVEKSPSLSYNIDVLDLDNTVKDINARVFQVPASGSDKVFRFAVNTNFSIDNETVSIAPEKLNLEVLNKQGKKLRFTFVEPDEDPTSAFIVSYDAVVGDQLVFRFSLKSNSQILGTQVVDVKSNIENRISNDYYMGPSSPEVWDRKTIKNPDCHKNGNEQPYQLDDDRYGAKRYLACNLSQFINSVKISNSSRTIVLGDNIDFQSFTEDYVDGKNYKIEGDGYTLFNIFNENPKSPESFFRVSGLSNLQVQNFNINGLSAFLFDLGDTAENVVINSGKIKGVFEAGIFSSASPRVNLKKVNASSIGVESYFNAVGLGGNDVEYSYFEGDIVSKKGGYVAGLVNGIHRRTEWGTVRIFQSMARGNITSTGISPLGSVTGGLATGSWKGDLVSIMNSVSLMFIRSESPIVGGVIGYAKYGYIAGNKFTGQIRATKSSLEAISVGGIAGKVQNATFEKNENLGKLNSIFEPGGIVGEVGPGSVFTSNSSRSQWNNSTQFQDVQRYESKVTNTEGVVQDFR